MNSIHKHHAVPNPWMKNLNVLLETVISTLTSKDQKFVWPHCANPPSVELLFGSLTRQTGGGEEKCLVSLNSGDKHKEAKELF